MRELINLLDDILIESRGLGARNPGEEFVSTTNPEDKINVESVTFYPSNASQYPDVDAMNADIKKINKKYVVPAACVCP